MVAKRPMIVRSTNPTDMETPVEFLDSFITPLDVFYVRGHLYTPKVDLASWSLEISGALEHPVRLTMDDLKKIEHVTDVITLECAGNGRALFQPRVPGAQWRKGAVGTAKWTGVRLADVLKKFGAKASDYQLAYDGADRPLGSMDDFIRSIPVEKAMQPGTMLAWEMNDQPIPVQHGYPLRLLVPGWEGAASAKWLTRLNVQKDEPQGFFMKTAYRYPTRDAYPNEAIAAADTLPIRSLAVKSVITAPSDNASLSPGQVVEIRGSAWAGEAQVTQVDISTDGGSTWERAELGTDHEPYAWRRFSYRWTTPQKAGSVVILSRATDSWKRTQPIVANWNPSGYLYNAVDNIRVQVGEPSPQKPPLSAETEPVLPAGEGGQIVEQHCSLCHDSRLIVQQRLSETQWTKEIAKMKSWGAPIDESEAKRLADYLFEHFHN